MNALPLIVEPMFMILLILATATALYMGLFKAHRPTVTAPVKWLAGIVSSLGSAMIWIFLYSWYYLSW